jgi:eukaryotic-like serine/threonine-protein kinase
MPQLRHVALASIRPALPGDTPAPERVGPYELLLPIASGGMATVFLARKRGAGNFERLVALKLTHAHLRSEPGWADELVEEAKLAAGIRHPNVVQVLDVEDDPAGVFLVMEYVEGDTLAALMRHADRTGERVPLDIALRILADALAGLHAAHELRDATGQLVGLVHRDFTPHNVLIGVDGVARLTDFGVAKAATRVSATSTGIVKGKAGYMPPEQVRGEPLDRRGDVWAAGVVTWELLAGRRLHRPGMDPIAMLLAAVSHAPARLREVWPDAPASLDETVAGALQLDRARRWPTAENFRERLVAAAGAPLADAAMVADYVTMVAGASLEKRRAQIAHVDQEARLARSAPPPAPAPTAPAPSTPAPPAPAEPAALPPTPSVASAPPSVAPAPPSLASASGPAPVAGWRRFGTLLAGGLVGAVVAALIVVRVMGARTPPSPLRGDPATIASGAPAPAVPLAPATAPATAPAPPAANAAPAASAPADPGPEPSASTPRGARVPGARTRPRPSATPPRASGDRPLAASPYE